MMSQDQDTSSGAKIILPHPEPSKMAHVMAWVLIACLISLAIWPVLNFVLMSVL
jgi:hypothetical protein